MKRDELRSDGFLAVPTWLAKRPDLSPAQKLVASVIIDHLGQSNDEAWPGPSLIANALGLSLAGVKKAIRFLKRSGILAAGEVSDGRYHTRRYSVTRLQSNPVTPSPGYKVTPSPGYKVAPDPVTEYTQSNEVKQGKGSKETAAPLGPAPASPPLLSLGQGDGDDEYEPYGYFPPAQPAQGDKGKPSAPSEASESVEARVVVPVALVAATGNGARLAGHSEAAKVKPRKLTDADKAKVCSSPDAMTEYLRSVADWRVEGATAADPKADQWEVRHFAAYYWFRVSKWRAAHNAPLALPMVNKLEQAIKGLRDTLTPWQFYCYIGCIVGHFDLLCWRLGRAGQTMTLNESSLTHGLLRGAADALSRLTDDQIAAEYGRMQQAAV